MKTVRNDKGNTMRQFYVIKKIIHGDYLLSGKNEIVKQSDNENACWICFADKLINRKSDSDVYVMCSKISGEKYVQIMCER